MNKDFERCCSFLADMIIKYAPEIKDDLIIIHKIILRRLGNEQEF